MDASHPLFQVLTWQGIPWAQVDEVGQILLAGPQDTPALTAPALPLAKGAPWPPEFPARGGPAEVALEDQSTWLVWPLEDGSFLVVPKEYWPQRLAQERARMPKFISVVTHELRLPLTSIKGYADLLLKGLGGALSPQQTQFLEVIRNNVQRMATLLDRLSDMGKLESGRLKVQRLPVTVCEALEQVLLKYRPLCQDKAQTLEMTCPEGLPPAQGDPQRLVQVLEALVDNAYRYTPSGGRITLGARGEGQEVQIWVQDTGIGISPQDQAHLFEPFFRSEDQAVRDEHGWGLSLHVASLLVARMGGRITFQSTLGQGSRFTVHLAVAPQEQLEGKP